jgi:hypothetical protein
MKHNLKILVLISKRKGQHFASALWLSSISMPGLFHIAFSPVSPFSCAFAPAIRGPKLPRKSFSVGAFFAFVRHLTQL